MQQTFAGRLMKNEKNVLETYISMKTYVRKTGMYVQNNLCTKKEKKVCIVKR